MLNEKTPTIKTNEDRLGKFVFSFSTAASMFAMSAIAFSETDLSVAITNILNQIGTLLTSVFAPLCVLILGWAIVKTMVGSSSKSAEEGIAWAKRAIICFVVFFLLGSILSYGQKLFNGAGTSYSAWKSALITALPLYL